MPILVAPEPEDHDAALIPPMDKWAATVTSTTTTAGKAKQAYLAWRDAVAGY